MRELRPGQVDSAGRQEHRARYAHYMTSPEWYQRRFRWLQDELRLLPDGMRLRCIGGCRELWTLSRDDLHHVTYERLGAELHEDLWPMCRKCHSALHELLESTKSWRKLPRTQANQLALGILLDARDLSTTAGRNDGTHLADFL